MEELLASLREIADQLESARADMSAGMDSWAERAATLEWWLTGTNDPDALDVLAQQPVTTDALRTSWEAVDLTVAVIEDYIGRLEAVESPSSSAASGNSTSGDDQAAQPSMTAPDGSRYPRAVGWAVDVMPRRVREGQGDRTVGYADGAVGQPFTSGHDQTWTPLILERARAVGLPARFAGLLGSHVEMKVATAMIQRGRRHSELVINHVPCGSQAGQRPGCHQALEKYLPEGHTLTVHGTTQGGEPYSHTYHGRAQR
ncbi:DddA-like double-stranded DNA deaminase toxin [Saccharopolyspora flava]|uniref:DddA-like double-stranded DNA deaminase toxin n=1 Tax=Saccharopolyspora flava TaxID=95161 RepID=UPI0011148202|nr:DddA-like double-stranded DNA deaminase toxin [Saccharopolyspora flava]